MTGLTVREKGKDTTFINFDYVAKVNVVGDLLVAFSAPNVSLVQFNEYYKNGQWKEISNLEELSDLLNTK